MYMLTMWTTQHKYENLKYHIQYFHSMKSLIFSATWNFLYLKTLKINDLTSPLSREWERNSQPLFNKIIISHWKTKQKKCLQMVLQWCPSAVVNFLLMLYQTSCKKIQIKHKIKKNKKILILITLLIINLIKINKGNNVYKWNLN